MFNRKRNLIHIFWGDLDWGYLDYLLPAHTAIVITVHNPADLLDKIFRYPFRLERVSRFILMSPDQKIALIKMGVPETKCVFIPHGIDTKSFAPGKISFPWRSLKIIHVGGYLRDFNWSPN